MNRERRTPTPEDIRKAESLLTAAGYSFALNGIGLVITRPGESEPDAVVVGTGILRYASRERMGVVLDDKGWFCGFDS